MELRQLRAFVAVADCLNFTQAAEKLFLTQPALSKQIAALETHLGGKLFMRTHRGAELTRLGKELHEQARTLILQSDQLVRHAKQVLEGASGTLNIGISLSSLQMASSLTAKFRSLNPKITISIQDQSSVHMIPEIINDQIQIGFIRLPVEPPLTSHKILTEKLVLAVNKTHFPGESENDYLPFLSQLPLLRLTTNQGIRLNRQIEQFLTYHNIFPLVVQYASDSQTQLALVAAGIGLGFVPESAVSIAPPEVSIVHLSGKYTEWDIGIAWNPQYENPSRDAFIELVLSSIKPA